MSDENERPRAKSRHQSTGHFASYVASEGNATVRLETEGFNSTLAIFDGTVEHRIRLKMETLIALKEAFDMYYEAEIVKRGRP